MRAVALSPATRRLSTAFLFSKIGEFAFETAFAVAVVQLSDSDLFSIGIIYFLRYIPSLLFSPLGGWLADNFSKKNVLISAELLKGASALSLYLLFEFQAPTIMMVVLATMVMTAGDCLYTPTFRAYFPCIIKKENLSSLNSGIQAIEDCCSIIGPLLFSIISLTFSPATTFLLFSACLMVSIAWTSTLHNIPNHEKPSLRKLSIIKDTYYGVALIKNTNPKLFTVIFCTTVCAMFATSILRFILPAAVMEEFESDAAVGYIYSLLAAGTVLGSFLYEKFNPTTSSRAVVRYWFIYGLLLLASALALEFNTPLFIFAIFSVGLIGAFVDISIITNIQTLSSQQEVGKNFSLYYLTAVLGDALSGLIASLMFLIAGPATFMGMTLLLSIAPLKWNSTSKKENEIDHS